MTPAGHGSSPTTAITTIIHATVDAARAAVQESRQTRAQDVRHMRHELDTRLQKIARMAGSKVGNTGTSCLVSLQVRVDIRIALRAANKHVRILYHYLIYCLYPGNLSESSRC